MIFKYAHIYLNLVSGKNDFLDSRLMLFIKIIAIGYLFQIIIVEFEDGRHERRHLLRFGAINLI